MTWGVISEHNTTIHPNRLSKTALEWLTMSFPLCGVPHTTFGALNNASGSMYVYICFPRMIHRDEMTHRRANYMPKEVLDLFWGSILLPAIRQHSDVDVASYVALTLDEV